MKVLTAIQLKELDSFTIRHEPIESIDLMERAAVALVEAITKRWPSSTPVKIFAGPGNNGGDALAVARLLACQEYAIEAYLFNPNGKLSQECITNKERLATCEHVIFHEITSQFTPPPLHPDDLVIDGLFGTGLNKPLNGGFAALVKYINTSSAKVVAIDIPSGLMCEDNTYNVRSHIIQATLTLTLQLPKLVFLLADSAPYTGEIELLDIGLHPEGIASAKTAYTIVEEQDVASLLKPRMPFSHKGTYGHGLLVAGSYGMAGAAILGAHAALRSGIGKITVRTPQENVPLLQTTIPEAIVNPDTHKQIFSLPVDTNPYSAIAIGPGLGQHPDTEIAFIEQVRHTHVPLVIDADGLNILGSHKGWIQQIPKGTILTPHPKEFERISVNCIDSYCALHQAHEMAIRQQFYIILKGRYTAICTPSGHIYFNPTGNAGMATAGSGDVLTGILLALLAEGYAAEEACQLGVYLHGLAGDLAAEKLGQEGLMASDLIHTLPQAFNKLRNISKA